MGSSRQSPSLLVPGLGLRESKVAELKEEEEDWKEDWKLLEGHLGLLPHPGLPSTTVASDPLSSSIHSRVMKTWPSRLLLSWPSLRGRCMGGAGRRPVGRDKGSAVPLACRGILLYSQGAEGQGQHPRARLCRWLEWRQVSETCCSGSGSGLGSAAGMEPHTSRSAAGAWPVSSEGP